MSARRTPSEPVISFSELDGIRYLHFGSPWVQGAMDIEHPDELVLSYIQDMMAWLLFLEPPAQVLQLGLGAAALTKFTHRHCPDTATTVVEISQQLPWVARQWFGLPPEDDRLMLVQGDAADFVGDPANREGFGVIQVDLYDEEAAGPVHDGSRFYRSCYRSLAEPGIMVVNLFGRHASFARSEERIRAIFPQVLLLDPQDEGNLVLLALKGPPLQGPGRGRSAGARSIAAPGEGRGGTLSPCCSFIPARRTGPARCSAACTATAAPPVRCRCPRAHDPAAPVADSAPPGACRNPPWRPDRTRSPTGSW